MFKFSHPKRMATGTVLLAASAVCVALGVSSASVAQSPTQNGVAYAPDEWLFVREGRPWWHKTTASPNVVELKRRAPNGAESAAVERVKSVMASRPALACALVDGDTVVHQQFNAPADNDSVIFGMSMGKTVTAMGVGQAICAGKLRYDIKAGDVIPQLSGKPLGNATVRDLLKMASGTWEGNTDSSVWSTEQARAWGQGNLNLLDLVSDER
ncbi:MAG: serine hydrolase, partial [Casimicrobium sp.]